LRKVFLNICLLLSFGILQSQNIEGIKFGGSQNESIQKLITLPNGNFLAIGTSRQYGTDDLAIFEITQQEYPRPIYCDYFQSAFTTNVTDGQATSDGGCIVSVYGKGYDKNPLRYMSKLYKLLPDKSIEWERALGIERIYSIKELANHQYISLGYYKGQIVLALLKSDGAIHWQKEFGTEHKDYGAEVIPTSDGGFIFTSTIKGWHAPEGHDFNTTDTDVLVVKTDSEGNQIWQKTLGGKGHDFAGGMLAAENDKYYLIGSTQSEGKGSFDMWLQQIDEEGNLLWSKTFGGTDFDYGNAICKNSKGELYLSGISNSFNTNGHPDILLVKIDEEGKQLWQKVIKDEHSQKINSIVSTSNGGGALAGRSWNEDNQSFDHFIYLFDKNGNAIKNPKPSENIKVVNANFHFHKINASIFIETGNPSTCDNFQFNILDNAGNVLQKHQIQGTKAILSTKKLSKGIYLYKITSSNTKPIFGKFVILE